MASVPLAARLVEVIADRGEAAAERYRYGSGCIVVGRTVLTAAHVVAEAVKIQVRDPNKRLYSATVDPGFVGDVDGPGPDLALVEIVDPGFADELPPIGLARVDRDSPTAEPVGRCHAIGYPWFAETPSPTAMRETVDAIGVLPVASGLAGGLLSVVVSVAPRPLPPEDGRLTDSEWAGMSGAPVVAAGRLVGVVIEHAPRAGPSMITGVPLTALQYDDQHPEWGPGVADPVAWWSRLGGATPAQWPRLPVPPVAQWEPAYRDRLREFGATLHWRMPQLLGRQRELAEIAAFATGEDSYRWLVGGAYAGKSALMYEAVSVGLPDEVDVVCYFLSRRASDASSERFLAAVVPQLAYLCGIDPPVTTRDEFLRLWRKAVEQAGRDRRHLLLAVDGLDEDLLPPGSPSVASLLPTLVGERAHVLVTSRPRPELPRDVEGGHPLRHVEPVELSPFKDAEGLAELARKEVYDLTHGVEAQLAVDLLGLLTAAAGPLAVADLRALVSDNTGSAGATARQVKVFVAERAARIMEPVGPAAEARWQFAHGSLLEYAQDPNGAFAQDTEELRDPQYRQRIHRWAQRWRDAGWTTTADGGVPRYLLDEYPATLTGHPDRLAELAGDPAWIAAAIPVVGVDRVLVTLRSAITVRPDHSTAVAMHSVVTGQRFNLLPLRPADELGYVLRQLCLEAMEHGDERLGDMLRAQLRTVPEPGPIPLWTSYRASSALALELDEHDSQVLAMAAFGDGRVIICWDGGPVLMWDSDRPETGPVQLGEGDSRAVAVLNDGRVVTGERAGQVLVWDPTRPEAGPVQLGEHDGEVAAVAVLGDGRVVTGDVAGQFLVWDPTRPPAGPVQLGEHDGEVRAMSVLDDGRVVTRGYGRVLIWDPTRLHPRPVRVGEHVDWVGAVAVLNEGRVVTGDRAGQVLVWDPDRPEAGPVQLGEHDGEVSAVAVLGDGRVLSSGDGRLLMWDPDRPDVGPVSLAEHDGWATLVAVLGDGRVVTGNGAGQVAVWDPTRPDAGRVRTSEHSDGVSAMTMLDDGRVITGGVAGRVLVWEPDRPDARPTRIGEHADQILAVAVGRGGQVVTGDSAGRVLTWDPIRPEAGPVRIGEYGQQVEAVVVLGDGRVVAGGRGGRVLMWDPGRPDAGPVRLGEHEFRVSGMAVTGGGQVVSTGNDMRLLMWDPDRPEAGAVQLGEHEGGLTTVAVLNDGRLVTGGYTGDVLMWDPTRPEAGPVELGGHDNQVSAVAVFGDGRVVTGAYFDRQVVVWETADQTYTAEIACTAVALAASAQADPDRRRLAIAHEEGGWSLWSL